MKKNNLLASLLTGSFFFCLIFSVADAQTPQLKKQITIGGSTEDEANSSITTKDGGFLNVGYASSPDGDFNIPAGHGNDGYLIKFDKKGKKIWTKTYGSTGDDAFNFAVQTSDGYLISGKGGANDGDVSGFHGGAHDVWIVKVDTAGNLLWQKCFGGSNDDFVPRNSIAKASSNFVISASSNSTDGQVTDNHGDYDAWTIEINKKGKLLWEHSYGGSAVETAGQIIATGDGNFVFGSNSYSTDGQVTGNHGDEDFWWRKIDGNGNLLAQKCLGGSGADACFGVTKLTDGNYALDGLTYSNDGDVTGYHGGGDAWVLKLDVNGNIIWNTCLGDTTGYQAAFGIGASKDNGILVCGTMPTLSGGIGNVGAWKLDANGNQLWQVNYGGSDDDDARSILELNNNTIVISAYERSTDGDVIGNHGNYDAWLLLLSNPSLAKEITDDGTKTDLSLSYYPNPASQFATIRFSLLQPEKISLAIYNLSGQLVKIIASEELTAGLHELVWNLDEQPNINTGLYLLKLETSEGSETKLVSIAR